MSEKRSVSRVTNGLFVSASISLLALAGYSLWLDRSATAAVAGALCFAFLLLLQLPYLESMEVLTLKVKLRERLSDAESLTDQLRATASVSAQMMTIQLAFMNRMGSIPWTRKRALLADVEQNLSHLNVPIEKIEEYKRPFLNIVSFDLFLVLKRGLDDILHRLSNDINERISAHTKQGPIRPDDETYARLLAERTTLAQEKHDFHDVLADPRLAESA